MKGKIKNQFIANYILMFIISIMIGIFTLVLLDFSNDVLSKTLAKNQYTAKELIKEDYNKIDTAEVIRNGGGVQVINHNLEKVFSKGVDTFTNDKLTIEEFTKFLIASKSIGIPYSYDIEYNSEQQFWLIVTFPTSIRIDVDIAKNKEYISRDMNNVIGAIVAIVLFYLLLLAVSTVIYSKITAISIVNPLKMLCNSAGRLKDGDYSSRVKLNLKNEFGELEDIFNSMAEQIEQEISLRKESEEKRRKLVLDISHDLKNPLASIMGYAELFHNKSNLTMQERETYSKIIYDNSIRANNLINDLFELSKMDSTEYVLTKKKVDICEYVREIMVASIPSFDQAGFNYEFDIPNEDIFVALDQKQMMRVFQNLITNSINYNKKGTKIYIKIFEQEDEIVIIFKDNGIGIPPFMVKDIFQPFVRVDVARNSETGGTGLGLAIVKKIISEHGGSIALITDVDCGCEFIIKIPKV